MNEYLKDLGVGGRIILKEILNKYEEMAWTKLNWLSTGTNSKLF
jgi:hypothetical protein